MFDSVYSTQLHSHSYSRSSLKWACLSLFRLPVDSFSDSLMSIDVLDEHGKRQTLYLFEHPQSYRSVRFLSSQSLIHTHHLLEPNKQLRREQPGERFQVLVESEVKNRPFNADGRKSKQIPSLDGMKIMVDTVIENRKANENADDVKAFTAEEEAAAVSDSTQALAPIETIDAFASFMPPPKETAASKRRQAPKRSKAAANPSNPATSGKSPVPKKRAKQSFFPKTEEQPATQDSNAGVASLGLGVPESSEPDELADAIAQRTGSDPKAVRNLNVHKILAGEQLGRTIAGASWTNWPYQSVAALV